MRFLVEACAGRHVAEFLAVGGHDVLFAHDLGRDPGDSALLTLAFVEGRIIVTVDQDYGALIFHRRQPHAGLVRLPDVSPRERIELLGLVLALHLEDLGRKSIITAELDGIRVTPSPT